MDKKGAGCRRLGAGVRSGGKHCVGGHGMRRQGPRRKERTNVNNNRTFPDIIIDVVATTFGPAFALMPMPPAAG